MQDTENSAYGLSLLVLSLVLDGVTTSAQVQHSKCPLAKPCSNSPASELRDLRDTYSHLNALVGVVLMLDYPPCSCHSLLCMTQAQERLKAAIRPTVHEMMFFMNAWALALLSVAAYASGQWADGVAFISENPFVMVRDALCLFSPLQVVAANLRSHKRCQILEC